MVSIKLQVLLSKEEYKRIQEASHNANQTVTDWVRDSIRKKLREQILLSPEQRLSKILGFAQNTGPTGDIDQLLAEIEAVRNE